MTKTSGDREATAVAGCRDEGAAVLYVCAERSKLTPGFLAARAESEGRAVAQAQGLRITDVITDAFGEPDPCRREGWLKVRELAESGTVAVVMVRWPTCIAPDSAPDLRHREIGWLRERGVRVRYSWAPLAANTGEAP
ncbi:hypothetical protein OIB37_11170 [Streptomyces sp. NBC_00820]|uniref:hypothetical protein n=1 Tax=Streptomyces sp. NBC_00820 TaxID=2975842 RepID=UPI002ED5FD10|nr:hypothetical protein OIB37_11170 [Streptomyces sp. NBC_00820]